MDIIIILGSMEQVQGDKKIDVERMKGKLCLLGLPTSRLDFTLNRDNV